MYRVLVGKPEGKRPLGRPRRRWVGNTRMDLQEVGCGYVDWIGLAEDREDILKEKRRGKVTKAILFSYDNALAHRALATQKKLASLGF